MIEILKQLNALSADELEGVIMRANIILEKKRKEEAENLERERLRREQELQAKQRQEEIAALERKLAELKGQTAAPTPAPAPQVASAPVQPTPLRQASQVVCPNCKAANSGDSVFCEECGQRISRSRSAAGSAPQTVSGKVSFTDGSLKNWDLLPGECSVRKPHEITLIQPEKSGKYFYSMEVTNKRLLISRQHVVGRGTSTAGLLGGVLTELAGGGIKPWAEIPLTAIRSCGLRDKKEFVIEADVTFVMKNKKYEEYLPELVNKAKNGI